MFGCVPKNLYVDGSTKLLLINKPHNSNMLIYTNSHVYGHDGTNQWDASLPMVPWHVSLATVLVHSVHDPHPRLGALSSDLGMRRRRMTTRPMPKRRNRSMTNVQMSTVATWIICYDANEEEPAFRGLLTHPKPVDYIQQAFLYFAFDCHVLSSYLNNS